MKDHHQVRMTEALVSFIASDLLPLSVVESPRFHTLMSSPLSKASQHQAATTKVSRDTGKTHDVTTKG